MRRKILLIEPNYKNKYPPMGLMKIATYYRKCNDDVRFFKGDLKVFAARLLCEEFYESELNYNLGKYLPDITSFIRTGKKSYISVIPSSIDPYLYEKLRQYHIRFIKKDFAKFDIVCVTTLFTFYWKRTVDTINESKMFVKDGGILRVGGIAATILPEQIYKDTGIYPHIGLLDKPGIYDKDNNYIIDELPLDYSILYEIDYKYPTNNAYFGYMTRGCPRNCAFCAVKTLEPHYNNYIGIKDKLSFVDNRFGEKKDLLLMDNNVFASNCFNKIIDEIKECGFGKGAKYTSSNEYSIAVNNIKDNYNIRAYTRKLISIYDSYANTLSESKAGDFYIEREKMGLLYPETATRTNIIKFDESFGTLISAIYKTSTRIRYVDFNQGLDARLVTEAKMKKLSEINIRPLRIAFDHYEQKETYCKAIRIAAKYGISILSNYLLYNFQDYPEDLYYRMRINVDLCKELGVTIYSFPMKYHPISDPDYYNNRNYIGKHWNKKFIRTIQAILNSTKGKVGPGIDFFEEAFGKNIEEFRKLLWMPEEFIIHRRKYNKELRDRLSEKYSDVSSDANDRANEWWNEFLKLSPNQLEIAKSIIANNHFQQGEYECDDKAVLHILEYYK